MAQTYQCGANKSQMSWCCYGSGAVTANFCSADQTGIEFGGNAISGVFNHQFCCPQGTKPVYGFTAPYIATYEALCCKYDAAQGSQYAVAVSGVLHGPLCCPNGWTGNDSTETSQAFCSYRSERCTTQEGCENIDPGDTISETHIDPQWQCRGNSCMLHHIVAGFPSHLCYREYTVLTGTSAKGKICKGGSWEDAPANCNCGDCEEGVEDDPNNPDYCPTDCGSTTGTEPTSLPIPIFSCRDLCKGEGTNYDPVNDTFTPGEHYADCCMCVCGLSVCPKDITESYRFKTENVWTEVGCINATEKGIVIAVMRIFLGVVTTIALFRFIQAAFMMNTDDPEKIKEGKSIFASAIAAIFAAVLMPIVLNFMGIKILGDKIGAIFDIFSR